MSRWKEKRRERRNLARKAKHNPAARIAQLEAKVTRQRERLTSARHALVVASFYVQSVFVALRSPPSACDLYELASPELALWRRLAVAGLLRALKLAGWTGL